MQGTARKSCTGDLTPRRWTSTADKFCRTLEEAPPYRVRNDRTLRFMNRDLSKLLREWPFQPGQITARIVTGEDGEPKVQVRLDLGIIQLNADGRPDGEKPFGFP